MFLCPHCRTHLQRVSAPQGVLWRCPGCEGRAVGVGVLRKILQPGAVNSLWQNARSAPQASGVACPLCRIPSRRATRLVPDGGTGAVEVDVCLSCPSVWFDTHELERLGRHDAIPPKPAETPLPPKAREMIALAEVEAIRRRADADNEIKGLPPDDGWKTLLTVFGIPVEENAPGLSRWPWVTWATVLLMAAATLWAWAGGPGVTREWGLLPSDLSRAGGLTLLSSFFLHAGLMHFLVNAGFLLTFGDNTEDFLGHLRYVFLLLGAALFGDLVHLFFDARHDLPLVGASGGISGVIAFYALQFPRARLVTFVRFGILLRWVRIDAWFGFVLWLGLQGFGIYLQTGGLTLVSSLAHVGGAAFGAVFWLATRRTWRGLGVG